MKKYSKEFKNLIEDKDTFQKIMEFNGSPGNSYREWEEKRKFIARAINNNGTILDIGCAGGFFLKSLQEWSGFELVPYGIDIDEKLIKAAKELFQEYKDNFVKLSIEDIDKITSFSLPNRYDFVYVSVPGNLQDKGWRSFIKNNIFPLANQRLIFGFYGSNAFPFDSDKWKKEREYIKNRIEYLKTTDFKISGTLFNPTKFNQGVAWIDFEE